MYQYCYGLQNITFRAINVVLYYLVYRSIVLYTYLYLIAQYIILCRNDTDD